MKGNRHRKYGISSKLEGEESSQRKVLIDAKAVYCGLFQSSLLWSIATTMVVVSNYFCTIIFTFQSYFECSIFWFWSQLKRNNQFLKASNQVYKESWRRGEFPVLVIGLLYILS